MIHKNKADEMRELASVIQSRLADYSAVNLQDQQAKLVAAWRAAYPDAAAQRSDRFHPLIKLYSGKRSPHDPDEVWASDIYHVTLRRGVKDRMFKTDEGIIQIGISCLDGMARHDWRDMQAIKNQLAGPECEALELYPAESRLLDPSNYYTLWCFPGVSRIRVGVDEPRRVWNSDEAMAPQRGFEE